MYSYRTEKPRTKKKKKKTITQSQELLADYFFGETNSQNRFTLDQFSSYRNPNIILNILRHCNLMFNKIKMQLHYYDSESCGIRLYGI